MRRWSVAEMRWASEDDLGLPFWSKFDRKERGGGDWADAWERPFVFSRVPSSSRGLADDRSGEAPSNYVHLSARWGDGTDVAGELEKVLSAGRHRAVVTVKVGDGGLPKRELRTLEAYLHQRVPSLPSRPLTSSSSLLPRELRTKRPEQSRVLGMVFDSRDAPRSVAVLVPHWESPFFLRMCLSQLKRHRSPWLEESVYVLDDTSRDGSYEAVRAEHAGEGNVHFHQIERADRAREPNVGYLLDEGLSLVDEQYVATIDADLFPISSDWLSLPIWIIETRGCSSVGMDTALATDYCRRYGGGWWRTEEDGWQPRAGEVDNGTFSVTNNLYRVMPTASAKVVSENIGFRRCQPRARESALARAWLKADALLGGRLSRRFNPRRPYLPEHCDNGVAANHFVDVNRLGNKFNIPLTSYIGTTPRDGAFGQNISGLAFHYALSTRALSSTRREIDEPGEEYRYWVERLSRRKEPDEGLVEELVRASSMIDGQGHKLITPEWHAEELGYIRSLVEKSREYFASGNAKGPKVGPASDGVRAQPRNGP